MRVGIRVTLRFQNSKPARALRALVASYNNGASWWYPDTKLATRAFILPITVLTLVALMAPLGLGWILNHTWFYGARSGIEAVVYRYSYPGVLFLLLLYIFGRVLRRAVSRWRTRIRDEVYLVGERLHNLGEKKGRINRRVAIQ